MRDHKKHRRTATRAVLLGGLATAFPAYADDLTISTATSTPVATATAANSSPGNITVASGANVTVTSGTAATINSSNSIINNGRIASAATSNATGVLIDGSGGPINATLNSNGPINVGASNGTGNTGLLISGGPVSGSIVNGTSSSIIVAGDSSTGVSIAAPFTGNIALRGVGVTGTNATIVSVSAPITGNLTLLSANSSVGSGGYGLIVTAPISGAINNSGTIAVGTAATVDSSNNPVAALSALAGTRIAASVGGGLINDRFYIDANGVTVPTASVDTTVDSLVIGTLSSLGTGPALWVAPDAANPQAVTLGVAGTGDDAYAIVNRGTISAGGSSSGNAATAVRIGGGGATTTLQGGFNSQANGSITATALNSTATAIDLQAGAVVPVLRNQGAIGASTTLTAATSSVPVSAGGVATGILVEAGASLPTLNNSGSIAVSSVGANNNSYAILDRSGTLTSITNSGAITATATGAGGIGRAIDLSASKAAVTVANSGTITGGIFFGNGNSTLALSAGTIIGPVAFGSGSNLLAMSGTSTLASAITSGAPLAVTLADTAKLDLSKSPQTFASIAASGSSVLTVPVGAAGVALNVAGRASFTQSSVIQLSLQSLAAQQNLTVVQASGGVSTDHLATLIDASSAPYLFTAGAATETATTIGITLTRKSADQIGLTGPQAVLYNQSLAALSAASPEASAIANLPDQASVVSAYRQIAPPSVGRGQLRVAESIADAGFGAAADRLAVVEDMRHHGVPDIGVWAQELGDFASQSSGANQLAFHTDGFGLAAGIDGPLLGLDAVGVALLMNGTTLHQSQGGTLPELRTRISTDGVEPYLSWSWKALFVQANGLAAHVDYKNNRTATFGTLSDPITSDWKGMQYAAGMTLGARLDFGHFRITPTNTLSWTRLTQDGYTEQGGGPLAMIVDKQTDTATFDTTRLAFAYLFPVDEDSAVKLEVHGGYMHQFNAKPTATVASFVGGGDAVTLLGDTVGGNEKNYGAAIGFVQEGIAGKVSYDRRQSSGFHDQSVAATMGFAF